MSVNLGIDKINLFFSLITNLDTKEIDNFLVKNGFNYATSLNNNNDTALHYLLLNYNFNNDNVSYYKLFDYLLKFFIDNNISLNLKNNSGHTILELSLKLKDDYIVSKLVNSNLCSLNIKNNENISNSFYIFNSENICDINVIENILKLDKDNTLINEYPDKDIFENNEVKEDINKLIEFNSRYELKNFSEFYDKIILLKNKNNFFNLDYYFTLNNKNINLSCWLYNQKIFIDCFKKDINILYYPDNNKNTPLHHLFKYQKWEILEKINEYLYELDEPKKKIVKKKIFNIFNNFYNKNNYLISNILYYNLNEFLKKFKNINFLKKNLKLDYSKILINKIYNNSNLGRNILKDFVRKDFYFDKIIDYYNNSELDIFEKDKLILKKLDEILFELNKNNDSEENYMILEKFINLDENLNINTLIKSYYESLIVHKKYIISSIPFDLSKINPNIGEYIYKIFYLYKVKVDKLEKKNNDIILTLGKDNFKFNNNKKNNNDNMKKIKKKYKTNYENYFSNRNFLIMYNILYDYLLQLNNIFIKVLSNFNNITKNIKTINFMSYNDFINIDFSFFESLEVDKKYDKTIYDNFKEKITLYLEKNNKFNKILFNQIKDDINITTLKTLNFLNLIEEINRKYNFKNFEYENLVVDEIKENIDTYIDNKIPYDQIIEWNKTSCEINNNILLLLHSKNFKKLNVDRNNFYYVLSQYINKNEKQRKIISKFMPLFINLIKIHLGNLSEGKKYFEYKLDADNKAHLNIICNVITGGNYFFYDDVDNAEDHTSINTGTERNIKPTNIYDENLLKQFNIFYFYSDINEDSIEEKNNTQFIKNRKYLFNNTSFSFTNKKKPNIFKFNNEDRKLDILDYISKIYRNLDVDVESHLIGLLDEKYEKFDNQTEIYAKKFIETWNTYHDEYILISNYEYKKFLQFSLNNFLIINSALEKKINSPDFTNSEQIIYIITAPNTEDTKIDLIETYNIRNTNLSFDEIKKLCLNNIFLEEEFNLFYDYNTYFEKKLNYIHHLFSSNISLHFMTYSYEYEDDDEYKDEKEPSSNKINDKILFNKIPDVDITQKINNKPYNLYTPKNLFYILIRYIKNKLNYFDNLKKESKENWEYYKEFFLNNKDLNKNNKNILFMAYLIINYDILDNNLSKTYSIPYSVNSISYNIFYNFFNYIEEKYIKPDIAEYIYTKIDTFEDDGSDDLNIKIYLKTIILYSCSDNSDSEENLFYKFLDDYLEDKFQDYKNLAFNDNEDDYSISILKNKLLDCLVSLNFSNLNDSYPLSNYEYKYLFSNKVFNNIYDTSILSTIIKNYGYDEIYNLNNKSIDDIYNTIKNNLRNNVINYNSKFIFDNNLLHYKFSNLEIIQNKLNIQLENILIYISEFLDIILENPQNFINQILILYKNLFNIVKTYTEYNKLKNL